jgi:hypothetical protein
MPRAVLADYLAEIARIRATGAGTDEISYYGSLAGALNATGQGLKPKVFCVPNLANRGAGFPDLGLFAGSAFDRSDAWPTGRPPERGVVEIDDIPTDVSAKLASQQVERYLSAYHLVLVTNYRDFELIGRDAAGRRETRERFSFNCPDADSFFALARSTQRPRGLGTRFAEFLERVLLHQAPLARPEDVAFFFASYARDALARVEEQASLPAFAELRMALQDALGLVFEGQKGEHLFRSTLVQTLFYGLFSAWVEVARQGGGFDWRAAGWSLHVPFVDTLFQRIATLQYLKPLGLEEPLSWASGALNRVDKDAFFARFQDADAVRYFYEPFLAAFDPALRKDMGVWYTPREIVRYMVERVDRVLRTELEVADGLADPSVWILDPCCGTGAYLVEVLDRIARTLREKGEDALVAEDLKQAALSRVAGFEIMPAPYVIAHWQVGHMLRQAGAPLAEGERAAVYLTNALTGWAAPTETDEPAATQRGLRLTYPPLADERDEASRVKQSRPILVVLGNPPYNAYAGTSPAEESGLVEPYKEGLREEWGIKKYNLDDLYVRFFRIAERRIAEGTGRGVVCFITNHSWTFGKSYTVMRKRMTEEFDRIWIDNLHGDRKISEYGPDGRTSETVFAIRGFSPGIQQGTAVSLLVRRATRSVGHRAYFNDRFNASKADMRRQQMIDSLDIDDATELYENAKPTRRNWYSLPSSDVTKEYDGWFSVSDISAIRPLNGLMEKRGGALIDDRAERLRERMRAYLDAGRTWEDVAPMIGGLARDAAGFPARATREKAIRAAPFSDRGVLPYFVRPFDTRSAYVTDEVALWNRHRPELLRTLPVASGFLATRPAGVANPEGSPIVWTPRLGDDQALRTHANYSPVFIPGDPKPLANLSPAIRAWLAALDLPDPDTDRETAFLPWHHALAIGYAPAWLSENADGIRQNWPRVPLPVTAELLRASAALGARVAALLDPDTAVTGVTTGTIDPALARLAITSKQGGGSITEADRALSAGWGHTGKGGAVMPGRGRVITRPFVSEEAGTQAAFPADATNDIFLNDAAYWRNVPDPVWNFTIGGYQVLKKWLSYRERPLLGRPLETTEIRYVTDVARRLAALCMMRDVLDANYRACVAEHRPLDQTG